MATMINYDDYNKVLLVKQQAMFADLSAKDWIACANKAIKNNDAFYVALSGGTTPLAIYQELVDNKDQLKDTSKIFLFWGDERDVPPTAGDSNFGRAMSILYKLDIPHEQIFRMEMEDPDGAYNYENTIKKIVPNNRFDMIMLGMGNDGHTASLFPGTAALHETESLVMFNDIPQLETKRMTLTLPCIQQGKHIAVYVSGEDKKSIINNLFNKKETRSVSSYPIESVGSDKSPLFWIIAPDAYENSYFEDIPSIYKMDLM